MSILNLVIVLQNTRDQDIPTWNQIIASKQLRGVALYRVTDAAVLATSAPVGAAPPIGSLARLLYDTARYISPPYVYFITTFLFTPPPMQIHTGTRSRIEDSNHGHAHWPKTVHGVRCGHPRHCMVDGSGAKNGD